MNAKGKLATSHLVSMRKHYGVVAVKAEFEAMGIRFLELLRLKLLTSAAGLNLMLKIGGPEGVWGVLQGRQLDVLGLVAPMVESPFGLSKYLDAIKKHIPEDEREDILVGVNIETYIGYQHLSEMLKLGKEKGLDAVTLGRVDLVGSMGLAREDINSPKVTKIARDMCIKVKRAGLEMTMGGGVEVASYSVVKSLVEEGILDRFETRMVVFPGNVASNEDAYEDAIRAAHQFELLWLEDKKAHYTAMAGEDESRIPMLWQRAQTP
jgi:hypothetical protein